MNLFQNLFAKLNQNRVKYMVAGGVAVNLYGIERATADLDIVLDLSHQNILKFIEAAKTLGLNQKIPVKLEDLVIPEKRREWIETKNMKVFSLYDPKNPFLILDILIEIPLDFHEAYKRRKRIKIEGITIPLLPLEDLISMKEKTERPQDKADVFYLKKIMEEWKDEG